MSTFRLIRTAVEISISFAVAGIATKDTTPTTTDAVEVTDEEVEESI